MRISIFLSKFLESPPEPMSLRLSSNLMIGVSRIYGQMWTCYYSDVSTLLTNMNSFKGTKSVDMPVKKAVLEDITLGQRNPGALIDFEDPLKMLGFDGLDMNMFEDFKFQGVSNTPEQVRKSMSTASSVTRANQSIDVARGGLIDSRGTSLSGAGASVGTQFGANDEDMNYYGFG